MMKKNIKNIVIICMASIALTACNDWTEVENIKVNQPGVEDTNPELYVQYLQKCVHIKTQIIKWCMHHLTIA